MPAASSSPIDPAIGHLVAVADSFAGDRAGLLAVLAQVPDPRKRRGVRHRISAVLGIAVCAVLAGARSYVAIAEWAADADPVTLAELGGGPVAACESSFRRTLQRLDADALDDAFGGWAQARTAPEPGSRRRVAVDGKTLRGSAADGEPGRHLLAAFDHLHGVVLGQVDVDAKTNEIPMFATLLDRIDLTAAIVTADAMHAQRDHAEYLARRGAHYLVTVKRNQPSLHAQLAALPWRAVPVADEVRDRGHGRAERRTLKITAVAAGLLFPHAAQALQIVRRRRPLHRGKRWSMLPWPPPRGGRHGFLRRRTRSTTRPPSGWSTAPPRSSPRGSGNCSSPNGTGQLLKPELGAAHVCLAAGCRREAASDERHQGAGTRSLPAPTTHHADNFARGSAGGQKIIVHATLALGGSRPG
jgi:predicted transposase YbfD/YdcC